MELKEIIVDETEWWDRIAAAVEQIEDMADLKTGVTLVGDDAVKIFTDRDDIDFDAPAGAHAAAIYFLSRVDDVEILRRLSQMPDETPLDLLMRPLLILCPDESSAVCVNAPTVPFDYILLKIKKD